tara:strand:+ start:590 stop:1021 length:432 start_codon:yes stop_codon:yes gene_type:complete
VHKLDPHTLFSIFEQGDEQVYKENHVENLLDNPYVLIGMVVTGIDNFYLIDQMYTNKHPEDYGRVRDTVKHKYFVKLYRYLERVTPVELDVVYRVGTDFELDKSLDLLNDLLFYFESIEEYERCGRIKTFTDLLMERKLETLL